MAEGWEDIPVAYTAEEWEALPQSMQALHSGTARPLGSKQTFGAGPRMVEGQEVGRAEGYYEDILVSLGGKPRVIPEGILQGELAAPSATGAFMRKVLERKQSGRRGAMGGVETTQSLKDTPSFWDAAEEFLQGKNVRGVSDRAARLPALQAAMFHEMNLLRQEEGRRNMVSTREAKEEAFRRAFSRAHLQYEQAHEQLVTKQSGAQGFWSLKRLFSEKGKLLMLKKGVGEYNPPPRYGLEFPAHPLMTVLKADGMDEHFARVTGGKMAPKGSTTEAHMDFMLGFRKDVFWEMGTSPNGKSVADAMTEYEEQGHVGQTVPWKHLGYESESAFNASAQATGVDVTASFILEQTAEATKAAGNFTKEANALQSELMVLQRQVQKGRYEEIQQAMEQQSKDYRTLTQAMGHDWNGAADIESALSTVLVKGGAVDNEKNRRDLLRAATQRKRGKLAVALEEQLYNIMQSRLDSETLTAEEAMDIWQRSISGQAKIGGRMITVSDEINKYTMPITGAQLLGYGTLMAYRAAMEHGQLMQMTIRDYDETNPEDAARQATFGHRLIESSRQAAILGLRKMVKGFGNAQAGGKVEGAITWASLPSMFMSMYKSDVPGYANNLLRNWFETKVSLGGQELDVLEREGPLQSLVGLPQTIPQYAPQRPGSYIEPPQR